MGGTGGLVWRIELLSPTGLSASGEYPSRHALYPFRSPAQRAPHRQRGD